MSQLKNCVEYYNREKRAYDGLLRQRKALEASLNINQRGNSTAYQNAIQISYSFSYKNLTCLFLDLNRSTTIRNIVGEIVE